MRALLLVDLQYDFMSGGALAVPDGDATLIVAQQLLPRFDLVVATQDNHPVDHGSFITQHPGAAVGDQVMLAGLPQTVWPVHCVIGSPGAEIHASLDPKAITRIFPKGTDRNIDSYSGFFDNGKRKATGLGDYLAAQGVSTVYVMGLALDYCVKFTALDALGLGFATQLILEGCRAVNLQPGDGAAAVDEMRAAGVTITSSSAIS